MKKLRNCYLPLYLVFLIPHSSLQASSIKWEIHQAFPSWVEGERWLVFVKLTNVSDEVIPLAGQPDDFQTEQIRVVPEWKNGFHPHTHGDRRPHRHLLQVDKPWKSKLRWSDVIKSMTWGNALKPNQSEVLGQQELGGLQYEYGMPDPHMDKFQFALRLGPDRYSLSESQPLVFANLPELEKHPVLTKIEKANGRTTPIRLIEINGENWLFQRSFRIARVPEGATPRFHLEYVNGDTLGAGDVDEEILVIEFDDVEEEPVRILIRQAFPLSGSKRTVPHLHLWRSLTDRSMLEYAGSEGGFFKESGLTLDQALKLKWDGTDPELKVKQTKDGK